VADQLRLFDVPAQPVRLRPATCALGRAMVAECRAVLAKAVDRKEGPK
jgi:hypothetical protein